MRRSRKTVAAEVVRSDAALARMRAACPWIFLLVCLASSLFQAWLLPPFQGPDELAHAYRVDLTTFGKLVAERVKVGDVAGGPADMSLYEAHLPFSKLPFHAGDKVNIADFAKAELSRWDGRTTRTGYPGSAIYPPFFYLPQGAGLAVGKLLDLSVVQSLFLARSANAIVCSLIGFAALLLAGRGRFAMFSVLLLPMSMSLYSTLSNDGLVIVTTALGCAAISRGLGEGRPMRRGEVIAATVCFALVAATKIPYVLFALVFLCSDMEKRRWRWTALASVFAAAIGWALFMSLVVQTALTSPGSGVDPGLQVKWLLGHPFQILPIAIKTMQLNFDPYCNMFIGVLGWLDTVLPQIYHRMAWAVLGLAFVASASVGREAAWRGLPLMTAAVLVVTFAGIHGALYVSWNPVGHDFVTGVQGRYFLPMAIFASLLIDAERPLLPTRGLAGWVHKGVVAAVLAFPLVSLLIVEHAIVLRYYLD